MRNTPLQVKEPYLMSTRVQEILHYENPQTMAQYCAQAEDEIRNLHAEVENLRAGHQFGVRCSPGDLKTTGDKPDFGISSTTREGKQILAATRVLEGMLELLPDEKKTSVNQLARALYYEAEKAGLGQLTLGSFQLAMGRLVDVD